MSRIATRTATVSGTVLIVGPLKDAAVNRNRER